MLSRISMSLCGAGLIASQGFTLLDAKKPNRNPFYADTNGVPTTAGGHVLHVGVAPGEVAPRVITVGTPSRARVLAKHLDGVNGGDPSKTDGVFHKSSSRGFVTYTGEFEGVPISIIAIGMGTPMMDFLVREVRHVVDGPMIFVRYGTCGGLNENVKEGSVVVASLGAVSVDRNPDAFSHSKDHANGLSEEAYRISKAVHPDILLSNAIGMELARSLEPMGVHTLHGLNATADSFYSSQGRIDANFDDRHDDLLEKLIETNPGLMSMEMETFRLFDLARVAHEPIKASAAAIVVANRITGRVMDGDALVAVEDIGGRAILKAVAQHPLLH